MGQEFTWRARRVLLFAQEEAMRMASGSVGTEHLLIGLLSDEEDFASQLLTTVEVTLPQVRAQVEAATQTVESFSVEPKFTAEANHVLELANEEAQSRSHAHIGSEHLLLALLQEQDGLTARILHRSGLSLGQTRHWVEEYLDTFAKTSTLLPFRPATLPLSAAVPPRLEERVTNPQLIAARDIQIELLQAEVRDLRATIQTSAPFAQDAENSLSSSVGIGAENSDLADVKAFMQDMDMALVFVGEGSGEQRVLDATNKVLAAPLFNQYITDAQKILVNVSAGDSLTNGEVEHIVFSLCQASGRGEDQISWSVTFKPTLPNPVSITVLIAGFAATADTPHKL